MNKTRYLLLINWLTFKTSVQTSSGFSTVYNNETNERFKIWMVYNSLFLLQTFSKRDYMEDHEFGYHKSKRKHKCNLSQWSYWLLYTYSYILRNLSDKDEEWDKKFYVSFVNVSIELTSRLFHKPNKPPPKMVWLVYQTNSSWSENKWKTGSGFKLIQNQFEKQMNSLPYCLVSAKQIRPRS